MFGLIDGNNFYVSCERAFDPTLIGKPVIVLSNNDGCVIARTNEAKDLGVKMGDPWHLVVKKPELKSVIWKSSKRPVPSLTKRIRMPSGRTAGWDSLPAKEVIRVSARGSI